MPPFGWHCGACGLVVGRGSPRGLGISLCSNLWAGRACRACWSDWAGRLVGLSELAGWMGFLGWRGWLCLLRKRHLALGCHAYTWLCVICVCFLNIRHHIRHHIRRHLPRRLAVNFSERHSCLILKLLRAFVCVLVTMNMSKYVSIFYNMFNMFQYFHYFLYCSICF